MECYYIVISSTRLSNGHFRNIKGVFRGPLGKNGNGTLDYAEKEKTIAKALEDLKANFYCELCDKQYYKHQEFDNHINSYDHAHKQRLKELKQREFARNVASKSRKDERKQEKALQRLHKLAELRKETVCAPGSGPMFKSTTVTVRENYNEISQRVAVDSVNSQQDSKCTLIPSEQNASDGTTIAADPESSNSGTAKTNQPGDPGQGTPRHKVGFSFAFPKKASMKLESSAAAFSESNDDVSVGKEFSRKSRFVPSTCHLQLASPTEAFLISEERADLAHPAETICTDQDTAHTQETKDVPSEKDVFLSPPFSQLQVPLCSDVHNCKDAVPLADQISLEDIMVNEDVSISGNISALLENKSTISDMSNDCISQPATIEENVKNSDASINETENKNALETLAPTHTEVGNITSPKKADVHKRQSEPFVPVLNKHGSTVLQWPSEMLVYTTTEPSISYSCNPLCFDFKSSKLNNNPDKNKLHSNDLCSQQKGGDPCKRSVSDGEDPSPAGVTDCEIGGVENGRTQNTPPLANSALSNSCHSGGNENMAQRLRNTSCRTRKTEKYFTKNHIKQDLVNEKYNKIRLKDTHGYWFHKSKRKKKRKFCPHHHGQKTKEPEAHCEMEMENSPPETTRKNPLDTISEKQYSVAEQLVDSHQLPDQRPKLASEYLSENEEMSKTWKTDYRNNDPLSSKNYDKKNTILFNRRSNPIMTHSGNRDLTYSRACCWKARLSRSSQDHKCSVLQNKTKCMSRDQPVKRGHNSLVNESERFHRKRRQHSHSYSSDESLNRQHCLPEGFLRSPSASIAPCKPKRKRRRKKSRFYFRGETLDVREKADDPTKRSSLRHLDEFIHEDKKELKPQEVASAEGNSEQTVQVKDKSAAQPSTPLPSQTSGQSEHLVMETTSEGSSEVSRDRTAPVCTAPTSTKEANDTISLESKERSEATNINEKQIPFKVPNIERSFRQPQPKSYLCHYELAEVLPQGKVNGASAEWLRYNSGILDTQAPSPCKEAHVSGRTFVSTEQILAPLALPEQALLIPLENHEKFKNLPCDIYQHIMQPSVLANKVKLGFPLAPLPPPGTPLQPLPLQPPLCSTSVTTIHHTVLQPHAAAGTFRVLQPHPQFLSQVPALARTSIPQISVGPVGPGLCPGNQPTFVAPPQVPIIPASVLHPGHLAFPSIPHALFPSLLSAHPTVSPLQPLF